MDLSTIDLIYRLEQRDLAVTPFRPTGLMLDVGCADYDSAFASKITKKHRKVSEIYDYADYTTLQVRLLP